MDLLQLIVLIVVVGVLLWAVKLGNGRMLIFHATLLNSLTGYSRTALCVTRFRYDYQLT